MFTESPERRVSSNCQLFNGASDFIEKENSFPPRDANYPPQFWREIGSDNIRYNNYLKNYEKGYLTFAVGPGIEGKIYLKSPLTITLVDDAPVVEFQDKWRWYTETPVRRDFYRKYHRFFSDGIPYLEPLEDTFTRFVGNNKLIPTKCNFSNDTFRVPVPIVLRPTDGVRFSPSGDLEIFSIPEFEKSFSHVLKTIY